MTAVITGGVCGIGRELAKDLTGRGDGVMIDDLALWRHGCCSSQNSATTSQPCDSQVSDRTLVAATIAHAESTLGLMGLWINNAVIMPTVRFSDQPIELSRAIIELDYVSVVEATRAILPVTLARRTKHRQDRNGRKNPPDNDPRLD